MALTAQLYRDDRGAARFRVEFDATLRDPSHVPIDVVVEDLSASGFRMLTGTDLAVGDEIGLGLAGIGTHRARVVRQEEGAYGCEFIAPLTGAGLSIALSAPSSAPIALSKLGIAGPVLIQTALGERTVKKLPIPVRLLAIVVLAVACWLMVAGLGAIMFRAFAPL